MPPVLATESFVRQLFAASLLVAAGGIYLLWKGRKQERVGKGSSSSGGAGAGAGAGGMADIGSEGAVGTAGEKKREALGVRLVCISDTHGRHRDIRDLPAGDILVHAGDFTHFGKEHNVSDFNAWLGEVRDQFQHVVVVNGNHEHNAPWKRNAKEKLSHADFLLDESKEFSVAVGAADSGEDLREVSVRIHGTQFFWPMDTPNPHYDLIPVDTDVLVCHGPVFGHVDGGGGGCRTMAKHVARVSPRAVVSGHIHGAHGVEQAADGVTYVNAAVCGPGTYAAANGPEVVTI